MDIKNSFPGYQFVPFGEDNRPHNLYRDEDVGFGGYVYAEPGIYSQVAVLDVQSQHPTSIVLLDLFGPYTEKFKELLDARLAIKRQDYETASSMLDGKLARFLLDDTGEYDIASAKDLAYALKIVINIVYGLTSAKFPNAFRDDRNKNNIVALRGALFMVDLKHAVQDKGFQVVHIKTDSIKIPNATQEIINFVMEFGKDYGYDFEHETTYDWFCLVNDAVYIAREINTEGAHEHGDPGWKWTAVGAQFQHPYVFKTLFTHEPLEFDDFCEAKNVLQGSMYLEYIDGSIVHVGRTGSFVPVLDNGGTLWRIKDEKKYAVTGTKDRVWIPRDLAVTREATGELKIDMDYFYALRQDAVDAILKFDPESHDIIQALKHSWEINE